jgi:hypothetical protein
MMVDYLLSPWAIFSAFASLTAGAVAIWWFAPALAVFFTQTKMGRYIAAGAGVVFAIWFAAMKLYQAGKTNVKDQIRKDSIQRDQIRDAKDAERKTLDDAALRKRAHRWMRND